MTENLTTLFYLGGGTITTIASLLMFGSYLKTEKAITGYLSLAFFFVGVHALAFALPVIIDPQNIKLLQFGYASGIVMIFMVLLTGLEVQRFMTKETMTEARVNVLGFMISVITAITIIALIVDPRAPIINQSGIIFWNANPLAEWLIGLTSFIYGIIWGTVFYRGAVILDDLESRFKLLVVSANGFILGTVALLVHTSSNEIQTLTGHILFIVASVMTLAIYLIPKKLFRAGS